MNLRRIFTLHAPQNPKTRAYFEIILDMGKTIPAPVLKFLYEHDLRISVVDALNSATGFSRDRFPDGRAYWEVPALYRRETKTIVLPLRQKSPAYNVWYDCYDFVDRESLVRAGKLYPAYLRRDPDHRTHSYRKHILHHELGHAYHRILKLHERQDFLNAYIADQDGIVATGIPPSRRLKYMLAKSYGGYWPDAERGLPEILAECFTEMTAPETRRVDIPRSFPRTLTLFRAKFLRHQYWLTSQNLIPRLHRALIA